MTDSARILSSSEPFTAAEVVFRRDDSFSNSSAKGITCG